WCGDEPSTPQHVGYPRCAPRPPSVRWIGLSLLEVSEVGHEFVEFAGSGHVPVLLLQAGVVDSEFFKNLAHGREDVLDHLSAGRGQGIDAGLPDDEGRVIVPRNLL